MIDKRFIRRNERIRVPQIRLIGSDGKQIGVVSPQEGLARAREEGLDLVEISPTAKPPVCRITDFGKYLYTLEKEEKQARKKQHVAHIKEIKVTSKIWENDYQTKLRSAIKFLERGDKVKLTMFFRGREVTHLDLGRKVLDRFTEDVADIAEVEKNSGLEGRMIIILLTPKPGAKKKLVKTQATTQDHAKTENQ
ncbi:MAG: translation initiation factor IF-3 [Candidatus Omnitrophica bacterium]|nr:translation initiation factor IF-3 [Candidatus Omnitrophota bacterium]